MRVLVLLAIAGCLDEPTLPDKVAEADVAAGVSAARDERPHDQPPSPFEGCDLIDSGGTSGCFGWSGCAWQSTQTWQCACGTIERVCSSSSGMNGTHETCSCTLDDLPTERCGC